MQQLQSLNVLAFSTYNFHLLRSWVLLIQFFTLNFFLPFLMSSSHLFFGPPCGHIDIGFHLYTFFTILSSTIWCKWPNQLNCCAFMRFIISLCLINSSNSLFVLILHVPFLSFVGPKIFLNTFLSNTINLFLCFFQDLYSTGLCYYWSYNTPVQFQFWFLVDKSTFKEKLVCIICCISKCYSILDLFFYRVITCNWESNHVNSEWVTVVHDGSKSW